MIEESKKKPAKKKISHPTIFAAVAANIAIFIVKGVAAYMTGSAAMLSETIHSFVDSGNEALLLIGLWRSQKKPDKMHPFGYGKELYFWSFVVALMIFALGGGVSLYEGVHHILTPEKIENPIWNYAVLFFSFLFEGASLMVGLHQFRSGLNPKLWTRIQKSKDPSIFTVLLEDIAALAGLTIALIGIMLSQALNIPQLDGAASIGIGLLLIGVAFVLANECRNLLIGESLAPEILADIRKIISDDPNVRQVFEVLSMHLSPRDVLLNIRLRFSSQINRDQLAASVQHIAQKIRRLHPEVRRVFFASEALIPPASKSHSVVSN